MISGNGMNRMISGKRNERMIGGKHERNDQRKSRTERSAESGTNGMISGSGNERIAQQRRRTLERFKTLLPEVRQTSVI